MHRRVTDGMKSLCRPPRRPPVLPRGARWLLRLIPGAAASRSQREALLREPEMAALLAADPRLGRILRPLCRMLGVHGSVTPPAAKAPHAAEARAVPGRTGRHLRRRRACGIRSPRRAAPPNQPAPARRAVSPGRLTVF